MQSASRSFRKSNRAKTMGFFSYLKTSIVEIVLDLILCFIVYALLSLTEINIYIVYFIDICILLTGLARLLVRYMGDLRFWKDVNRLLNGGVESLDLNTLVHEPMTYQGMITYQAIDSLISDYTRSINATQVQTKEQKEFIETWIHEIKTPLAASYLIADRYPGAESIEFKRQLARIEAYTEQALFYARMQSLDRDFAVRKVSVAHIVNEAIKSRSLFLIENDIHIKLENLDQKVLCDEKWMIFILGQLIDNAIKYRDKNKDISYLEFKLSNSADDIENSHILSIIDNGIGIDSCDLSRVFDKGFTGNNGRMVAKEKATGLGLYLCMNLCKKMGIGMSVVSDVGEYTKVDILFAQLIED